MKRKKSIDIIASEAAFETLATFETLEQLNQSVRKYKENYELNKTEIAVLDILHRFSAKYKGVSFLCKNKIGELIGKSRRTIIRVCKRLETLGIIRQHEMKRSKDMQQTSNAIVIQPIVTQEERENVTPIKQDLAKTNKQNTKVRTQAPIKPSWIPSAFYEYLAYHFGSIRDIETYWRSVHAITYRMTNLTTEDKVEIGIESFNALKTKRRKLNKPIAYFVGTVKRKARQRYVINLSDEGFIIS